MKILSPSILTADFTNLGEVIDSIKAGGGTMLHFDVMDGIFVPSLSFGIPVLKSVSKYTDMFMDVHLMIEEPIRYIEAFADAGADGITVHIEACKDIKSSLQKIRQLNKKTGITLNPGTPISDIIPYLNLVDMVLVMSVNPGFGGQKLIPECLDKIRYLREYIKEHNIKCDIQIDGGVKKDNINEIMKAGANVVVAGSAVVENNIEENVRYFIKMMDEG